MCFSEPAKYFTVKIFTRRYFLLFGDSKFSLLLKTFVHSILSIEELVIFLLS